MNKIKYNEMQEVILENVFGQLNPKSPALQDHKLQLPFVSYPPNIENI